MPSENDALLERNYATNGALTREATAARERRHARVRAVVSTILVVLFLVGVPLMLFLGEEGSGRTGLSKDPLKAAHQVLKSTPVIDGHIDLPELVRMLYANNVTAVDLHKRMPGDIDIPRLREGKLGGFFWSVYTSCPPETDNVDFTEASWRVRDTLEQIDVSKLLIEKYDDTFFAVNNVAELKYAIAFGKVASLLGVEGAHQLGNSIHVLRQYYNLGVRYVTLTHACNNAFADSAGIFKQPKPTHFGLSPLGYKLIDEMNRLGVIVDLSHVSDDTARQAIGWSRAPVMWSHSATRAFVNISRNVPDDILKLIGTEKGKKDGVVMMNFASYFISSSGNATVEDVADHIEHIAKIAGKKHVGIGSDFDGVGSNLPVGLEDASKYPALFAELYKRGWNRYELSGLAGGNFVRVFEGVERAAEKLRKWEKPVMDLYPLRPDLPWRRDEGEM